MHLVMVIIFIYTASKLLHYHYMKLEAIIHVDKIIFYRVNLLITVCTYKKIRYCIKEFPGKFFKDMSLRKCKCLKII